MVGVWSDIVWASELWAAVLRGGVVWSRETWKGESPADDAGSPLLCPGGAWVGESWLVETPLGVCGGLTRWVSSTLIMMSLMMSVGLSGMMGSKLGTLENRWALYWLISGELGSTSTAWCSMWSCSYGWT